MISFLNLDSLLYKQNIFCTNHVTVRLYRCRIKEKYLWCEKKIMHKLLKIVLAILSLLQLLYITIVII